MVFISGSFLVGSNLVVNTSTYTYFLSVCGGLTASPGLPSACVGAGACQTKPSDASFTPKVLGAPSSAPTLNDNTLQLNYSSGSTCHSGNQRQAIITFVCSSEVRHMPRIHLLHTSWALACIYGLFRFGLTRQTPGAPVFVEEATNCVYSFVWFTSAACGTVCF